MKKAIYAAMTALVSLDWKACGLCLFGFLGAAVSDRLGDAYGVVIGLSTFLCSWWMVLAGLVIAHRKADLPIFKIGMK